MSTSFSRSITANTSYSGADMTATITLTGSSTHKQVVRVLGEIQTLSYSLHMGRGSVRNLGNINAIDFTNGPRTIAGSLVFAVFDRHIIREIIKAMDVVEKDNMLPDELPPFDITICFANEYGSQSNLRIFGVRLINEGEVLSTNDVFIENTYQYVAHDIQLMRPEDEPYNNGISGIGTKPPIDIVNKPTENLQIIDMPKIPDSKTPLLSYQVLNQAVLFDVMDKKDEHILTIECDGKAINAFTVIKACWPFYVPLGPGEYKATLKDANTVTFTIAIAELSGPSIYHTEATSAEGITTDLRATKVCYRLRGDVVQHTQSLVQKNFVLKELMPEQEYFVWVENDTQKSLSISLFTLALRDYHLDDFKTFMQGLGLWLESHDTALEEAKLINKPLLEAFYALLKKKIIDENFMHYVSYYDAALKESKSSFVFENKWLGLYRAPVRPCRLSISNNQQQQFNASETATDYLTYYATDDKTFREYLYTYRPSLAYMQSVYAIYEKNKELNHFIKTEFLERYPNPAFNTDYAFYDFALKSNGAYIKYEGGELIGVGDFDSFVIIDDLALHHVPFKQKAQTLQIKKMPYYCSDKSYIVYLEKSGNTVSKPILFKKGTVDFLNQTLLLHTIKAVYPVVQDCLHQALIQNFTILDTFIYAISLLFTCQLTSAECVTCFKRIAEAFDKTLFTVGKTLPAMHTLTNDKIYFDQTVTILYFSQNGQLKFITEASDIVHDSTGYIVFYNSTWKIQVLSLVDILKGVIPNV